MHTTDMNAAALAAKMRQCNPRLCARASLSALAAPSPPPQHTTRVRTHLPADTAPTAFFHRILPRLIVRLGWPCGAVAPLLASAAAAVLASALFAPPLAGTGDEAGASAAASITAPIMAGAMQWWGQGAPNGAKCQTSARRTQIARAI